MSAMESFPIFFKVRAITFTCIIIFSFLWLVLLSVEIFTRWSISDATSRSLMTVFVLTNTTTIIMLPILLLVGFRIWLDAARLFLLLIAQTGAATAFTYWNPQIQCPDQTTDDMGVCKLINVYTVMACWVIPAILVLYSTYFAIMVYRQSRIPVFVDIAPRKGHGSMLSMDVDPEMAEETRLSTGNTRQGNAAPDSALATLAARDDGSPSVYAPSPTKTSVNLTTSTTAPVDPSILALGRSSPKR
ncbi:hypothetical protein PAXINDRAFT_180037, partial [Paxillus involutus ATCC 200175]